MSEPHYHACPNCYENELCDEPCSIVSDLGEHKGLPMGSHSACSKCDTTMCERCNVTLAQRDGQDPTRFCDSCAQAVNEMREAEIEELRGEVARLRALIPTCDRGPKACDAEIARLTVEVETFRGCITAMLASASPTAKDHPTMWDTWGDASELIGRDRNANRIPHVDLKGSARALRHADNRHAPTTDTTPARCRSP